MTPERKAELRAMARYPRAHTAGKLARILTEALDEIETLQNALGHENRLKLEAINHDRVSEAKLAKAREALVLARKTCRNSVGAIESGQMVDKEVEKSLWSRVHELDSALTELGEN